MRPANAAHAMGAVLLFCSRLWDVNHPRLQTGWRDRILAKVD